MDSYPKNPAAADIARRMQQSIREDGEQRPPLGLAYLTVICVLALCGFTLWIEYANIALALRELFPTLSNGFGYADVTQTLAFASVGAILLADVILARASKDWSERTWRWVNLAGVVSLALFVVAAMTLLPASVVQANDASDMAAGDGAVSQGAYLAFALMLAALFPISVLANFFLFQQLKPALAKIEAVKQIDGRIRYKRRLLAQRDTTLAAIRKEEQQQRTIPSDAQVAQQYAARTSAIIGQVAGELHGVIDAREAAGSGSAERPLVATNDELLNHLPIEKLRARLADLRICTPEFIFKSLVTKEA